jgi:imidazolonepropionase-like amidohydrolase
VTIRRRLRIERLFSFAVLASVSCSAAPEADLLLMGARVIDGTGSGPSDPAVVQIHDGRISAIDPAAGASLEARDTLDLTGRFLLPGFVDLHVHLPPDEPVQDSILSLLLRYGTTAFLNPGAREGAGVRLRDRLDGGTPRMLTAGPIIEQRASMTDGLDWAVLVSSETEAADEVARQADTGVDFIKFYSGVVPSVAGAIVDRADDFGLPVIAHAGQTTWLDAVDAGVSMLVHSGWGTPMDQWVTLPDADSATDADWYGSFADAPNTAEFDALVGRIVEEGVTVVPTLSITQASGLGRDATLLPRFETHLAPEADLPGWWSDGWRERHPQYGPVGDDEAELLETVYWPGVMGIVRAMYEGGVHLGVGTDVGNSWITPGPSFHYEMGLYAEAGIPPIEILRMATKNGAEALGLDSLGTVEVGKLADLLVLGSDPSVDIAATRDIEMVLLGGEVVHRR